MRVSQRLDHLFKDREIYLRGEGNLRYLSLSRRRQMRWAAAALGLGAWVVVSTGGLVFLGLGWSQARQEIVQHRLTYLDFLSEVGNYHQELARVVDDFESNQSMLLSRLELASGPMMTTSDLRAELERTETDKARVLLVRERARAGLQDLESELKEIAARDADVRARLDSATRNLQETQAEGSALVAARDRLDQELTLSEGEVRALETQNAALAQGVGELERRLAGLGEEKETLAVEGAALRAEITSLYGEIAEAPRREGELLTRIEELEGELEANNRALARGVAEFERDFARLGEEKETLVVEGVALRAEIASLYGEIAEAPRREGELLTRIENLESELEANNSALAQGVAEFERDFARLGEEKKTLVAEGVALRAEIANLNGEIAEAPRREGELLTRIEELESELKANNSALAQGMAEFERDFAGLGEEKKTLVAEGAALRAEIANLTREIAGTSRREGELQARVEDLEGELEANNSAVAQRVVELQRDFARLGEEKETLAAEGVALRAEIASLYGEIAEAPRREGELRVRVEDLEGELEIAVASAESMASQRDFYETRTGTLETRLEEVSVVQKSVIQRLSERTLRGIDMIERIVAMTGLNVNELILGLQVAGPRSNQGGPFVPGDFLIGDDPYLQLQSTVVLLDQQMNRWEALQQVVRVLPLASPLDQYRLTSGYGERTDPVNGRKAKHAGVDLKAPMRTPVLATAPGTVSFAGWKGFYGRLVEIDHGNGIRTRYGHLRKILVKAGQEIAYRGEIGLLGSSGRSTGPHVHYEIFVNDDTYDPSKFLLAGRNAFKG